MSYTTIKALWPGEKHEDYKELRNSHGSGPAIWDAMCQKYLGGGKSWLFENWDHLWALWKNKTIPTHHRAVLMMTFDRAYVTKKDYPRAASGIRQFLKDFPPNPEYVNHWSEIADLYELDPDIPAIGLYCTSVSDDPFEGEWNEETEKYDQIDWSKCYDLYKGLDAHPCVSD